MNLSSNSSDDAVPDYNDFNFPRLARFVLYLILDIPSIICSLIIITIFLINRQCRKGLQNYAIVLLIFILLLSELIDIPIYMDQLVYGSSWSKSSTFCYAWHFIDSSCFAATPVLLAWLSIERHIIIFNIHLLNNEKNKILFHYIPPIVLIVYIYLFYFIVIVYPPCENVFDEQCGGVCYFYVTWLSLWDLIGHNIIPTLLIIIFSSALVIRTARRKKRLHQRIEWRKFRRMTLQFLSITSLFLIFCLPATICFTLLPFGTFNTDTLFVVLPYAAYFSFYPQLLLPFVCFFCIPELWPHVKRVLNIRRQRIVVAPLTNRITAGTVIKH